MILVRDVFFLVRWGKEEIFKSVGVRLKNCE
jgi:hypothetical protein